jgi:SAM-dependent methyltransferase
VATTSASLNADRYGGSSPRWRGYYLSLSGVEFEERVLKTLQLITPLEKDATYLDIGCNDGFLTKVYAERIGAKHIFGVDIVQLDAARENGVRASYVNLDDETPLPFDDKMFDVITCCAVLEHIHSTDFALDEIFRLLKDEGYAIIMTPRLDSFLTILLLLLGYQPPDVECSSTRKYGAIATGGVVSGHFSHFTKRALFEILRSHSFQVLDYVESSLVSDWELDQRILGQEPGLLQRSACLIFKSLPWRKEQSTVKIKKARGAHTIARGGDVSGRVHCQTHDLSCG